MPNGDFVFVTDKEMVVTSPSGAVIASRTFPPAGCGVPSGVGFAGGPPQTICSVQRPLAVATDTSGHIWTVVQGPSDSLIQVTTLIAS